MQRCFRIFLKKLLTSANACGIMYELISMQSGAFRRLSAGCRRFGAVSNIFYYSKEEVRYANI